MTRPARTEIITLEALQDLITFCGKEHGEEAASILVKYQNDPATAQRETRLLLRRVISDGDVGVLPSERIQELAAWSLQPPTAVLDQNRTVVQLRLSKGDRAMLQELADVYTGGNLSAMIIKAVKHFAGINLV